VQIKNVSELHVILKSFNLFLILKNFYTINCFEITFTAQYDLPINYESPLTSAYFLC